MGFIEGGPRRDHQLRRFVVQHGRVDGSMSRKRLYAFKADPLAGEIGKTGVAEPVRETSGLFMSAVSHFLTIWYRAWRPIRRDGFLRFPKMG